LILRIHHFLCGGAALCAMLCAVEPAAAQPRRGAPPPVQDRKLSLDAPPEPQRRGPRQTASIHWQDVPLGEAVARLRPLFAEVVFVDRRVDPDRRVTLDIDASSAEQVMTAIAAADDLGTARIGKLIYLGPKKTADGLKRLEAARASDVARLPAALRATFTGKRQLAWPRLAEPRAVVDSALRQAGWKLGNPEQIPFDLWAAGALPELTLAEQLTLLLAGFDLTFKLHADERVVEVVPLPATADGAALPTAGPPTKANPPATQPPRGKQVFSLRVEEKPVGAVLRQLAGKLNWSLQIDDDAIRAAGLSLDQRVSFSVDQVDQEKLLDALLTPAGLEYKLEGNQLRVMPQRYRQP